MSPFHNNNAHTSSDSKPTLPPLLLLPKHLFSSLLSVQSSHLTSSKTHYFESITHSLSVPHISFPFLPSSGNVNDLPHCPFNISDLPNELVVSPPPIDVTNTHSIVKRSKTGSPKPHIFGINTIIILSKPKSYIEA